MIASHEIKDKQFQFFHFFHEVEIERVEKMKKDSL